MQSFVRRLKWYGHRGLRIEYILIACLTGLASLQTLYFLGGRAAAF
jgi:hypothetical protein